MREHRTRLQVFRLKPFLAVNLSTRQHEGTLAAIVERARFIDLRNMRLDDLPDEKTVLLHHFVIIQTAFEVRIALVDQRRLHPSGFYSGQPGCRELVAIVNEPAVRDQMAAKGIEPMPMETAQFVRFIQDETVKWRKVVREAGIKVDQ